MVLSCLYDMADRKRKVEYSFLNSNCEHKFPKVIKLTKKLCKGCFKVQNGKQKKF